MASDTSAALDELRNKQVKDVSGLRERASTVHRVRRKVGKVYSSSPQFGSSPSSTIRPMEAQLARLQGYTQRTTDKLAATQAQIQEQLVLPENERDDDALDKLIDTAVMLRQKTQYFADIAKELAEGQLSSGLMGAPGPASAAISSTPVTTVPAPDYEAAKQLRTIK